ncbi:hypothetical protein [Halalkalicoccus salilacus]|uniref:hypothetical protein n=1 Tax=Halalkalicoccus sp. GCM10025704 TaxID=3252662 RepID=UPI00362400A9
MARLRAVVHDERMNALIGWMLTGIVVLTAVESLLTDAFLWAGVALLVVVVAAVPAVVTSEWTMMVPWPLLLVAAVAMIVRRLGISVEIAGYFVVVALALIVVIELDAFTPVEMTRRFAVAFAALMTLAVQGSGRSPSTTPTSGWEPRSSTPRGSSSWTSSSSRPSESRWPWFSSGTSRR